MCGESRVVCLLLLCFVVFRFAVCEFPFVFFFFWFKAFWCVAAFLAHSNVKTIFKLLGRKLDHATVLERFSGDTKIVCLNTESIFVLCHLKVKSENHKEYNHI